MILHICILQMGFLIHIGEGKKWCTLESLQMVFLYSHKLRKKKYCTLATPQMVFLMHARKGNK